MQLATVYDDITPWLNIFSDERIHRDMKTIKHARAEEKKRQESPKYNLLIQATAIEHVDQS